MSRSRVVITGIGMVTPLGHDTPSTWASLVEGRSGAGPITQFDPSSFAVQFACEVKDWRAETYLGGKLCRELDRFSEFAIVAADEAVRDAGLSITEEREERAGCIVGTGVGGLATIEFNARELESRGVRRMSPYVIPAVSGNLAAGQITIRHRLRGPSYCTTSACATGAHAVGEAAEWIRRGHADVMVAGAAEAPITRVGMGGFQAMRALSRRNDAPARASRPFDVDRDGFVAGEGAAILILERLEHAHRRGAKIYGELTGYGASSDAFHICQPPPTGEGCARSMKMALSEAKLAPSAVGYLNAHATSTGIGDVAEANGIRTAFGAAAESLWVSSTKSMTGHTLGAAGAIEAAISLLALHRGVVPATINVDRVDPAIGLDVVPNAARTKSFDHVMSNAFGFGGANATLVFSSLRGAMASS
ncbi:MAG: beta-ketoacyl-ACP synthase II [Polyangiaceae bacterium]|nr:beta-ketoacyl-ACP synthase II [Polyangiaceae bacterium]